jgi:hypothetical protein
MIVELWKVYVSNLAFRRSISVPYTSEKEPDRKAWPEEHCEQHECDNVIA